MQAVTARVLREAIGVFFRDTFNANTVEEVCTELGFEPPAPPDDLAFSSKRGYVVRRLQGQTLTDLATLAVQLDEEHDVPELRELIARLGPVGVTGQAKNLIFGALGPKHRMVLSDAINNDVQLVGNEQYCLYYDRPLDTGGLIWRQLTTWWSEREHLEALTADEVSQHLYRRLTQSLDNEAEELILRRYAQRYVDPGRTFRRWYPRCTCTTTPTPAVTSDPRVHPCHASGWTSSSCFPIGSESSSNWMDASTTASGPAAT